MIKIPEQDIAANPAENIWVQANAGTGKTTVLVQRLLRILFRSPDLDNTGVLCLTYTNAAAGEMRNRILSELQKWASLPTDNLREALVGISESQTPSDADVAYARKIFFIYIDKPDLLKIKTIHGFCEEILKRFPIEAGISPAWTLVSDDMQRILLQETLTKLISNKNSETVYSAFEHIVGRISEYSMPKLLEILSAQYKNFFDKENIVNYRKYFVEKTKEFLLLNNKILNDFDIQNLQNIVFLAQNTQNDLKTPVKYLDKIINLTKQYIDNTIDFDKYKTAYLNEDGTPTKNIQKYDFLVEEQERVYKINQNEINKNIYDDTIALFDLASEFASIYKQLKHEKNVLDFEDLILYTRKLFSSPENMGWVLSQLDISLSHILLDEAQDTSPMQWDILRMLAGDFFTNGTSENNNRSLFVVGDSKQSIYSFMGADSNSFIKSKDDIANQIKQNLRTIREIPLEQSFRSLSSILWAVDTFFGDDTVRNISSFANNTHKCVRNEGTGVVEINKLISKSESDIDVKSYISIIANKIKSMLDSGQYKPSDIMVLVQKRNPLAPALVNELKRMEIDVAGSDRIILPQYPAIKDLLNLIRFCINNDDEYSLCCVLKSPLYRFSEQDIYNLCQTRAKIGNNATVFDVLQEYNAPVFNDLTQIIEWAKILAPYSFFTQVLIDKRRKMISALGNQIIDPLEEFMTICLAYERTQPGTLKHFLKWFITGNSEIKRDMDASSGVRVMTVHGSKGLQSKVVFLIDTVRIPTLDNILPIPNTDAWLWIAPNTGNSGSRDNATQNLMHANIAEYYRLLYVAMTRARDELYIYGFTPYKNAPEISWHNQLWRVFSQHSQDDTIRITHE